MSTSNNDALKRQAVELSNKLAVQRGFSGHYLSIEEAGNGLVTVHWNPSSSLMPANRRVMKNPGLGIYLNGMLAQALWQLNPTQTPVPGFDEEELTLPLQALVNALTAAVSPNTQQAMPPGTAVERLMGNVRNNQRQM